MQTNDIITDGVSCFVFFFSFSNNDTNTLFRKKKNDLQTPQLSSAQRSPSPAHRPQSAHYPGGVSVGRSGSSGSGSRISQRPPGAVEGGGWDNLGCDVPPPLPARNRSLVSHNSSPLILSPSPAPTPGETPSSPPPPLPPRNPSTASSSSCSSSSSSSSTAMPDLVPSVNGASNQDQHRILLRDSPTNQPPSSSVS
jgi:hypothetical protein